ncbi:MAG: ATP-binding protein [Spirochaetales bacterium]|nr:ATP-binding protein [Spirochaetales bacterium]
MGKKKDPNAGSLRIGDHWNAITIIAYSQNNPLKAIAEFVENSIDAKARHIKIIRGKNKGQHYIKIIDDGNGINDFKYVATHIGDSIKRKLKKQGASGLQGEFGIGLLSFWTVGEALMLTSTGSEGITRRLKLVKDNPGYKITEVNQLFESTTGTELVISPLLSGIRQLHGEKIQNYLASELRDRITKSGAEIRIIDKSARKELLVEPRKFEGQLIHNLPECANPHGDIYCELYVNDPSPENKIGLYKHGTRVIPDITTLEAFSRPPWKSDLIEGIIDVSFLQLTPGTRDGIILDEVYESLTVSLDALTETLTTIVEEYKRAEEETASKSILKKISRAMKEALLFLPVEEYGWLELKGKIKPKVVRSLTGTLPNDGNNSGGSEEPENVSLENGNNESDSIIMPEIIPEKPGDKSFFDFPGPLHSAIISPASTVLSVSKSKSFQLKARDKKRTPVEDGISVRWEQKGSLGKLSSETGEFIEFTAGEEPGVEELKAFVTENDLTIECTAVITITGELFGEEGGSEDGHKSKKGLPGYTFRHCPGELWRSRYDSERRIIVINNGHADFLFAAKSNPRKLRYITKLYAKELVLVNFPEADKDKLLERMIELQLYTEENL